MKIIYDRKQEVYIIEIEPPENVTLVNTNDIAEAREFFLSQMAFTFNNAVCKQLGGSYE